MKMRSLFDRCFLMEDVQREGFIFLQMSQYLTVSEADSSAEMQRARGLTGNHNSASKSLHNLPAIAPRFWIIVALFSVIYRDNSGTYDVSLGGTQLAWQCAQTAKFHRTSCHSLAGFGVSSASG
jgi:hypothetical protein